jgi:hypothetical protein
MFRCFWAFALMDTAQAAIDVIAIQGSFGMAAGIVQPPLSR